MAEFFTFFAQFVEDFLHLLPWFVVAIALSAVLNRMSLDIVAERVFRNNGIRAVLLTSAVGAFSPFCSFTVIPIIRRFLVSGVPLSAVMAFWIASPTMDPEIFAFSAAALGIPIALARLIGAVVLSVGTGLIVLAFEHRGAFANVLRSGREENVSAPSCSATAVATSCSPHPVSVAVTAGGSDTGPASGGDVALPAEGSSCSGAAKVDSRPMGTILLADLRHLRLGQFLRDMWADTKSLGLWLVGAVAAGVAISLYVPQDLVSVVLGAGHELVAIPAAALVSIPLYLNGVGAIPVVQGLMDQGMSGPAAVTFLLGGAVTTVPAMIAVRSVVNNRVFLVYLAAGLLGAIAVGYALIPFL
ncbi:MAG: permease [Pseudonocardiaceae bacterium]